jgi:hypothetical protein
MPGGWCTPPTSRGDCGDTTVCGLQQRKPEHRGGSNRGVLLERFGAAIDRSREEVLDAVFDRNPYRQRGGWYLRLAKLLAIDLQAHPAYTLLFTGPSEAIACIRHVA